MAAGRRRRSARGSGDQLRDEILDGAERLLLDAGSMDDVSVRAIADAVGVTPPSIYLHFADKDDLFFQVCERGFADFERVLLAAVEGIEDPLEVLKAMGRAYIGFGVDKAEQYELLFGPKMAQVAQDRDLSDTAGMRAFEVLVEVLRACMASGRVREADPAELAYAVWGAVHGAVMLHLAKGALSLSHPLPDVARLADLVVELVDRGIAVGEA